MLLYFGNLCFPAFLHFLSCGGGSSFVQSASPDLLIVYCEQRGKWETNNVVKLGSVVLGFADIW